LVLVAATLLTGCSLLVSTSGLAGDGTEGDAASPTHPPPPPVIDGGAEAEAEVDASVDVAVGPSDGDAGDAPQYIARAETVSRTTSTSVAATFAAPLLAGDAVVCFLSYANVSAQVSSLSDTANDTYVRAGGPHRASGWSDEIWVAVNVAAGNSVAVSALMSAASDELNMSCHEYRGVAAFAAATSGWCSSGGVCTLPFAVQAVPSVLIGYITTFGTVSPRDPFTTRSTFGADLIEDTIVRDPKAAALIASCSTGCLESGVVLTPR
jgi:hypothetical protein